MGKQFKVSEKPPKNPDDVSLFLYRKSDTNLMLRSKDINGYTNNLVEVYIEGGIIRVFRHENIDPTLGLPLTIKGAKLIIDKKPC